VHYNPPSLLEYTFVVKRADEKEKPT